jgi:hypothetical protein
MIQVLGQTRKCAGVKPVSGIPAISKNRISKQFVFKKDTEASCKTKITNHGKKKNDKDEIGNILLKHAFTSLVGSQPSP